MLISNLLSLRITNFYKSFIPMCFLVSPASGFAMKVMSIGLDFGNIHLVPEAHNVGIIVLISRVRIYKIFVVFQFSLVNG